MINEAKNAENENKKKQKTYEEIPLSMKDSEEILRSIIENSSDQIFLLDKNYKYLIVNKALANAIGKSPVEIIGKTISDTYPEETATLFKANIDKVFRFGKSLFIEEKMVAQGRELDISTSLNPVFDKLGRIVAVTGIVRDITEHKELEKRLQEKERLATIGATAGMVGHDIRNPLQALINDMFLIEQEISINPKCENKEIALYIENINDNISYINKIISDLQDYTKTTKPTLTEGNLKEIVDKVMEDYKTSENILFQVDIKDDIILKTDTTYLKRILSNLASNAIQAMPKGGKLVIQAYREDGVITIIVEDTGVGIIDSDKPQLFKPLFTTKAKGQGLGLAVVKRFIEALNGMITFESQVGKGTKFTIKLPTNDVN